MNGNFIVNDGGKINPEHRYLESARERGERERAERARSYYPSPNEQAIEDQLFEQVRNAGTTGFAPDSVIWPEQRRIAELNALLFAQVAGAYGKQAQEGVCKPISGTLPDR